MARKKFPSKREQNSFKAQVYEYYTQYKRSFPWRVRVTPYKVLVSEIMLQQTQAKRVVGYFNAFIKKFPTVTSLSKASLSDVLSVWQGLGYNRRAKYIKKCAEEIVLRYDGVFPKTKKELESLTGIGPYTASAICIFAYNSPEICIETNIRTVYLHHFFNKQNLVPDSKLLPIISATLDTDNPAKWYSALMDYGSHLKEVLPNPSRKSKHHSKQSVFVGSRRQVRGKVIKHLLDNSRATIEELKKYEVEKHSVREVLSGLQKELLIKKSGKYYTL
ncbi:MAG: A/G-specific adenine glycosylase [Candidatus Paceibacterota bacterium]